MGSVETIRKILITGATGNVGIEVIKSLQKSNGQLDVIAGIRDLGVDQEKLAHYNVSLKKFDFTDISTYLPALRGCDTLFLLRPPQISDVGKYFKPLIETAKEASIKHIIFISVQGVEKSTIIPHHKIEKLIVESGIDYTFLRPAYFMQNFTTTLRNDLVHKKRIFLPAGTAKFTLVDVRDIGEVAAKIILNPFKYANKAYELTSDEALAFAEMSEKLSTGLGTTITYTSPNLFSFYWKKRKEKMPFAFILVMIMLHYLPRFQKTPAITEGVKRIIGREPIAFEQFVKDNKTLLIQ
jgi:uncharacterized protein YbjT (DUF2867 family)